MRPTQILLSGAEELGKNNKYVASPQRPDAPQIARPFLPVALGNESVQSRDAAYAQYGGNYANVINLGTLVTHGALSVSHPPPDTPMLKTSDETRSIPVRRHEQPCSTNGRCMRSMGSKDYSIMENVVLTAPHRHPRPEAEGHRHLWHGPEPTEPFRWRRSRRCL